MGDITLFHMWKPFRERMIERHKFYVAQAGTRLLAQFQNIEAEADKAAAEWLERTNCNFDPERDDPASYLEAAHEESIEFYTLLAEMHNNTRLSVVAGMFHEWEKQLRNWMVGEITHWWNGTEVRNAVWRSDFPQLIECFTSWWGWDITEKSYYSTLDACRLVVNVYKHGSGESENQLKEQFPQYLANPFGFSTNLNSVMDITNYTNLTVTDLQIQEFSDAIIAFWLDVPKYVRDSETGHEPSWIKKAFDKDTRA